MSGHCLYCGKRLPGRVVTDSTPVIVGESEDTEIVFDGGHVERRPTGHKTPLYKYVESHPRTVYGYRGQGYFCTMTCGWRFGLVMARTGCRLKAVD